MFKQLFLLAQAAALINAIPATREFGILVNEVVTGTNHSLLAVNNGSINAKVVQVKPLSNPGTPVFFNASQSSDAGELHALNFVIDVNGSQAYYGLGVPEVGDSYGTAKSVYAIPSYQQIEWLHYKSGQIRHEDQAALNSFYICKDHADSGDGMFLKWGTPNNDGSNPTGCLLVGIYRK